MTIDYSIIQKIKKNLSSSLVNCKMENHKEKLKNKEQNLIWNNKKKNVFFLFAVGLTFACCAWKQSKVCYYATQSSSNCFGSAHYLNIG